MDTTHNIFISHKGADDHYVQRLKERLREGGYNVRNSSIDSTKHSSEIPSEREIASTLRDGVRWAKTFICLIGNETHKSPWVNYEIRQAYLQGKTIVGVYAHGSSGIVELPEAFQKYGGTPLGWNSLDKLGDAIAGKPMPAETPSGDPRTPIYNIVRISC